LYVLLQLYLESLTNALAVCSFQLISPDLIKVQPCEDVKEVEDADPDSSESEGNETDTSSLSVSRVPYFSRFQVFLYEY